MRKIPTIVGLSLGSLALIACASGGRSHPLTQASPGPALSSAIPVSSPSASPSVVAPTAAAIPVPPSIEDGTWTVGEDVPAGVYKVVGATDGCYWAIYKSGTNQASIIDNHLGAGNLRVTLKRGQDFETQDCGTWTKIK